MKLLELTRDAEWFPPVDRASQGNPAVLGRQEQAPDAYLSDLHLDATGLIWSLIRVPRPDWRRAWTPELIRAIEDSERRELDSGAAPQRLWDTIIEAIDVENGRVVQSRRTEKAGFRILNDSLMATSGRAEQGGWFIDVFRVRLATQQAPH